VTRSQRFERHLVADPFHEYDGAQSGAGSQFVRGPRRLLEPPHRQPPTP
jgi:hypothetical protein